MKRLDPLFLSIAELALIVLFGVFVLFASTTPPLLPNEKIVELKDRLQVLTEQKLELEQDLNSVVAEYAELDSEKEHLAVELDALKKKCKAFPTCDNNQPLFTVTIAGTDSFVVGGRELTLIELKRKYREQLKDHALESRQCVYRVTASAAPSLPLETYYRAAMTLNEYFRVPFRKYVSEP